MKPKAKITKPADDGLHNTLLINAPESPELEEIRRLEDVPAIDPLEEAEIEAKIGDSVTLIQRLKRRPNELTVIVFFLTLCLVALAAFFIRSSHGTLSLTTDENNDTTGTGPWSLSNTDFIPSFKVIKDVLFFEGFYWAATPGGLVRYSDTEVKFYGGKQGIKGAGLWSLASTGDTLWVSYQGGVAKYDSLEDTFQAYFNDQSELMKNPVLFYDEASETLFLATFDGLYSYSRTADTWFKSKDKNAPENGSYFVATGEGVFVVDEPLAATGTQVLKYNRTTKLWSDVSPAQIADPEIQLVDVDGKLVALGGRPGDASKTTYLYRSQGSWQAIEEFNNALSRDAHVIPGPQTYAAARVRQTTNSGGYRIYGLHFGSDGFSYERLSQTYNSGPIDDELFSKEREIIAEVSGLEPYYEIYGFDNLGRMYLGSSSSSLHEGVEKILVADKSFVNNNQLLTLPEGSSFVPIFCGEAGNRELSFAFAGQYEGELRDSWTSAALYRSEDNKLSKILALPSAYLKGLNGEVDFICATDGVYWMAANFLWKFDPNSEKIAKLESLGDGNITSVSDGKNILIFWDATTTSNLVKRLQINLSTTDELDLGRPITGGNTPKQRVTVAGNLLWLPSLRSETLHVFNLDGVIQQSFVHDGVNGLDVLDAGGQVLIVQYLGEQVSTAHYSFINPTTFETVDLAPGSVPGRLGEVPVTRPFSAYDDRNQKVWISKIGSSVYGIEVP